LNIASADGIICVQRTLWNETRTEVTHYLDGLDGKTGELIWRDEWKDYSGSLSTGDGKVFTGRNTAVHCIDAATGERLWDFETPQTEDEEGDINPVLYDGRVYFGNHRRIDDYVYCLDADTGELIWKDGLGPRIHNIGGVTAAYGRIYVTGEEDVGDMWPAKYIYCLDPETGAHISKVSVSYFCRGKYPPGDYFYYFNFDQSSGGGEIIRMERATGSEVARFYVAVNLLHATAEKVYIGNVTGGEYPLQCLYGANGDVIWEQDIGNFDPFKGNAICFDGGEIYAAFDIEGKAGLYCLDAESGKELWTYETSDVINQGNISVVEGFVYVATDDGNLYCLRKQ
jgi:outer membrane protein assembly factor BamB